MKEPVLAWHWLPAMGQLGHGDPRPVVVGETLVHEGPVVLRESGLHASVRALDALRYALGPFIQRVECSDLGEQHDDKLVCRKRKCLWMADATDTLRAFARWCALSVVDRWPAPPVVIEYLRTGDESLRSAAASAAWSAAWSAAESAAESAAWSAAGSAAGSAQNQKLEEMLMTLAPCAPQ